ncbi:hypothetical protein BDW02DRAFT_632158 [Decorospora gaudefroyi]|uniref:Protein kinase domain-containing protein n=1 Tax=Decorospora gaudefroyi TaxID=184978 RepID=A0A6A5K6W7_9PLEO|nr:hypothetical protein BDW02DRAFT_632158 [Decorospora gaudefroyi]
MQSFESHSRNQPVSNSADDSLSRLSKLAHRSQLPTPDRLTSIQPGAVSSNAASVNPTHNDATLGPIQVQSPSYKQPVTGFGLPNENRCSNCANVIRVNHLSIPTTPRRDSCLRSPGSSDGDRDNDFLYEKLTPGSSVPDTDFTEEEFVEQFKGPLRPCETLHCGYIISSLPKENSSAAGAEIPDSPKEPEYDKSRAIDLILGSLEFLVSVIIALRLISMSLPMPVFNNSYIKRKQKPELSILNTTKINQGHDQEFLPRGKLSGLINPGSVSHELEKDLSLTQEKIRHYAKAVCSETHVIHRGKAKIKTFRKIFALLVIAEATPSISLFLEEDVSDLDLPLIPIRYSGTTGLCRKDMSGKPTAIPLRCFPYPKWSPIKIRNFRDFQWKMLAPFFSQDDDGDVKHYTLEDEHIVPFVAPEGAKDEDADITGGFGKVLMVRIHEDRHNFRDPRLCHRGFAVKQQLYEHDREAFEREISVLKMFSGARSHKHIVSLLATYEQFRKFHLIFYRAEGDLFTYWKTLETEPVLDYHNVTWVAEQCAGVAEALLKLHRHLTSTKHLAKLEDEGFLRDTRRVDRVKNNTNRHVRIIDPVQSSDSLDPPASPMMPDQSLPRSCPSTHDGEHTDAKTYGRHGDVNPGNILWYNDNDSDSDADSGALKGTLKLADFGQAEINSLLSKTKQRSVANTLTYRPPECDLQPRVVRQSYDIWCLGCVYLEFITWVLGGKELLAKFCRMRLMRDVFQNNKPTDTFFQVVREQETPKVMIKKSVTDFIDELHQHPSCTDYLHDFLNFIQNNMLVIDSADRASCEEVWRALNNNYAKCCQNESYATQKIPWSIRRKSMTGSIELPMSVDAEQIIGRKLSMGLVQFA